MSKLTVKQEKFVLKYFECGNGTEAYKHAFNTSNMKEKTINEQASKLLAIDKVTTRLKELRAKAEEKSQWNVQRVLDNYTNVIEIGLGKKSSKHIVNEMAGDGISNTIEVDMCDTNLGAVNVALNSIAKHLGMFTQKVEINGELSLKDFVKDFYEKNKGEDD